MVRLKWLRCMPYKACDERLCDARPDRLFRELLRVFQVLGMQLPGGDIVIGIEGSCGPLLDHQSAVALAKVEIETNAGSHDGHQQNDLDDLCGFRHCHNRMLMS